MIAARQLVLVALALSLGAAPLLARPSADGVAPPLPELRVPPADISETAVDALAPGDPGRAALLADLALRRHAEALEVEGQERVAHALALAEWRETSHGATPGARAAPPAFATPRADALRAEAVQYAANAAEEAPTAPELPDALLVGGIDAERIGRVREALRMLGMLIRRFPESRQVADAWLALGEHHLRAGDLTRARVAFDQAERRGRPAVRCWAAERTAEASLAAADLEGAVSAVERAIAAGSGRAAAMLERIAAALRPAAHPSVARRLADLLESTGNASRAMEVRAELAASASRKR